MPSMSWVDIICITASVMLALLTLIVWRMYLREAAARQSLEVETLALSRAQDERVAARTRELAALYDVSAVASQTLDLQTLLNESLARSLSAMYSRSGAIFLIESDPSGTLLHLSAHQGIDAAYLLRLEHLSSDESAPAWVLSHREPLFVQDVSIWQDLPECLRGLSASSLLSAPLHASGEVLGMIVLVRPMTQSFTLEEIALLSSLADQIGTAVGNDILRQRAGQVALLQERQNMSRDLHDSITQSLYGLVTLCEAGQAQLEAGSPESALRSFSRIGQTARQALREMRLFIHHLRPSALEKEGLVAALHMRLAAVEGRSDIQARILADDSLHLPIHTEEALYQIAQEALNNSMKHAHSDRITIYFGREERSAVLEVIDEGCGFNPDDAPLGCLGLKNMRERAEAVGAALHISSIPGNGTRVKVTVPGGIE